MFSVWPDALKKRTLRYLLQNYLGNFFLKNLSLDQLSIDLYQGTATITDIPLDVEVSIGYKYYFLLDVMMKDCTTFDPSQQRGIVCFKYPNVYRLSVNAFSATIHRMTYE